MKRNGKTRIFALMLSLLMIISMLPMSTISVSATEYECPHTNVFDLIGNGSYMCLDCGIFLKEDEIPTETEHRHFENRFLGKAPTCTEAGMTDEIRCIACKEVLTPAEVIPALGHSFDSGVVTIEPTESKTGVRTYTCTVCGETKEEIIESLEHEHSFGEWIVTKEATCVENGVRERSCSCGKTESAAIAASGHTEVADRSVNATCTETGLSMGKHCSTCGKVTLPQYEITALGHNYVEGICSRCGDEEEAVEPVKPTDPTETTPSETEPTPTDPVDPEPTDPDIPAESSVKRVAGSDRYETAFAIADELKSVMGVSKFKSVVLANSSSFADALAGSYLAAVKNAPIILVKEKYAERVCEYLNKNMENGSTIYILGGESAMPESILDGIILGSYNKVRLQGEDRYATNLAILKEASIGSRDLLVATGRDFADSLSASATGLPILLVNSKEGKSLSQEQKEFLANVKGNIYIIGGESAVNADFEEQINAASGKTAIRVSGGSRYETSVKIAETFLPGATRAVLAYSGDYPDGLCGGPLAYATGAPLLLTKTGKMEASDYTRSKGITAGYVLGSANLISDGTVSAVFGD